MKGIAYVGCRLLAIYWFIYGLTNLSYIIGELPMILEAVKEGKADVATPSALYFSIIPFLVYIAASIILWWKAERLSNLLVPDKPQNIATEKWDYHAIQTLIFASIGLYVLLHALPGLASALYRRMWLDHHTTMHVIGTWRETARVIQIWCEIALGVGMLLGARGLSGLLTWVREFGPKTGD